VGQVLIGGISEHRSRILAPQLLSLLNRMTTTNAHSGSHATDGGLRDTP
jgi:hypothetical protein